MAILKSGRVSGSDERGHKGTTQPPLRCKASSVAHGSPSLQPPSNDPAILPRGRGSQRINGVAHQAPDQGRSEGCVSRSEVAGSCGLCVFNHYRAVFGSRHTLKIAFDRGAEGAVCSNPGVNVPLIWEQSGNLGRRTVLGNAATQIRGSRPIRKPVHERKQPVFVRSRNNSGQHVLTTRTVVKYARNTRDWHSYQCPAY